MAQLMRMNEGLCSSVGKTSNTPSSATIFSQGPVLDAPSKKSCHTCPLKDVWIKQTSATSVGPKAFHPSFDDD